MTENEITENEMTENEITQHNFDDIDDMMDFFLTLKYNQLAILESKKIRKTSIKQMDHENTDQKFMQLENRANYSYEELLNHLIKMTGGTDNHVKFSIMPAEVSRFGVKKTAFSNFSKICEYLNRDKTHVNDYLIAELGTTTSEDGKGRLLIKGKYNQKNIHKVLEKYILMYVQCSMCKSLNTRISKNPANRLYFLECINCGSSKSVASVNKGFHATTKQDRTEARKN